MGHINSPIKIVGPVGQAVLSLPYGTPYLVGGISSPSCGKGAHHQILVVKSYNIP
jgi:hypothetical protein